MHLFLRKVVARLWELLAGENQKLGDDQRGVMSKANREAIGREIKAGRPTIPLKKKRALFGIFAKIRVRTSPSTGCTSY